LIKTDSKDFYNVKICPPKFCSVELSSSKNPEQSHNLHKYIELSNKTVFNTDNKKYFWCSEGSCDTEDYSSFKL